MLWPDTTTLSRYSNTSPVDSFQSKETLLVFRSAPSSGATSAGPPGATVSIVKGWTDDEAVF